MSGGSLDLPSDKGGVRTPPTERNVSQIKPFNPSLTGNLRQSQTWVAAVLAMISGLAARNEQCCVAAAMDNNRRYVAGEERASGVMGAAS